MQELKLYDPANLVFAGLRMIHWGRGGQDEEALHT